jgi:uncharacterized protein DUF4397
MRNFRPIALLIATLILLAACSPAPEPTATVSPATEPPTSTPMPSATPGIVPQTIASSPAQQSYLRIVHAAPNQPAVDVYVELLTVATGLRFEQTTDQTDIAAGNYTLRIVPAGSGLNSDPILVEPLSISGGQSLILLFTGLDSPVLTTLQETIDPMDGGQSRISAINAVPRGPAFTIRQGSNDLTAPLDFGQQSETVILPSNPTPMKLQAGTTALVSQNLDLRERHNYTLVLVGRPDDLTHLQLLNLDIQVPGWANIRAVNATSISDPLDLYLEDNSLNRGLASGSAGPWQKIVAGEYTLNIYTGGADISTSPIASTRVVANAGDRLDAILSGSADTLNIVSFRQDLSPTASDQARVAFADALEGARLNSIAPVRGLNPLTYGQTPAELNLLAGNYSFDWQEIDASGQPGNVRQVNDGIALQPGYAYLYVITGISDAPPLLLPDEVSTNQTVAGNATASPPLAVPTQIRLVNALNDATSVDYVMDNAVIAQRINYGHGSDLITVPPGRHTILVRATGTDSTLFNMDTDLAPSQRYSIFAYGADASNARLKLVPDSGLIFDGQTPHIRLINFSEPDTAPISLGFLPPASLNPRQPTPTPVPDGAILTMPAGLSTLMTVSSTNVSAPAIIAPGPEDIYLFDRAQNTVATILSNINVEVGAHYDVAFFQQKGTTYVSAFVLPYPARSG